MTRQEFFEIAGYFANPIRNTRIEIEARQNTINSYDPTYTALTGAHIPMGTDSVYELPNDADKWGREMRLYFTLTNPNNVPNLVDESKTIGGRHGYDLWDQRLNSKDIIDELFAFGFTLGHPQDILRIRALIPAADINDFNNGFNSL
jgi:hypothetical protein